MRGGEGLEKKYVLIGGIMTNQFLTTHDLTHLKLY